MVKQRIQKDIFQSLWAYQLERLQDDQLSFHGTFHHGATGTFNISLFHFTRAGCSGVTLGQVAEYRRKAKWRGTRGGFDVQASVGFRKALMCTANLCETGGVVNDRKKPSTAPIIMVELSIDERTLF